MSNVGILFLIFGIILLITGIYMLNGHKLSILDNRPAFKNITIKDWKNIGKYTSIVSIFILLISLLFIIFNIE